MSGRKKYIASLAFCQYLDRFLPFVYQHNKLRFSREIRENPLAQTIDVSLRLTPPSYQRLELYRLLREMRRAAGEGSETGRKARAVWYPACMVVKTEKNVEGVIRLLTEDLSPSIEFKIMVGAEGEGERKDHDRIRIECASVYNWIDIQDCILKQIESFRVCCLYQPQLLSIPTWIVTRIFRPNSLLMSSLAANSSCRRIFDTMRCCEGDWQSSSASSVSTPLIFFHPRCTTMSS